MVEHSPQIFASEEKTTTTIVDQKNTFFSSELEM